MKIPRHMYSAEALVLLDKGLIDPCDTRTAIYPLDPNLKEAAQFEANDLQAQKPCCQHWKSPLEGCEEKLDPQPRHIESTQ